MRRLSLVVGSMAFAALACDDPVSVLPTTPSSPAVASIELNGPSSIAPGQSVQLIATIRLADGTMKSPAATTQLVWLSSNNAVVRVTSTGVATGGQQLGDARITVLYGSGASQRQAVKEIIVAPNGTFRLVGVVSEADFPSVPVIGARVTVTPGSLTTLTGFDGRYQLYGVQADSVVTITKTGYTTVSQGIQLTTDATRNFSLALAGARLAIAGRYTLTIDLAGTCSSGQPLSQSLRRRTYDADITQKGPDVDVVLTEPRFRINEAGQGNRFTGRATTEVTFFLYSYDYYYGYYPSVVERLADGTILVPGGTVTTTGSAAGLSGNMEGSIFLWDARFPTSINLLGYCYSSTAQFTLTPR